ncbi:cytotoxic and regulatory T-cell molecule-like isoform X3 [Apostichopus japonicus]|uniref:cytotoxic and regulatory T-cell molecule-like isoform X3 n=1 Tax=Stichopus japonicus TaxID=307972 RepID=UPI003AB676D2
MEIYCLIIFLISFNFDGFNGFNNSISVRLVERDSVILECNGSAPKGNRWFLNDRVIFANTLLFKYLPDVNLSNSYSLSISNATINHQGLYRCTRNFTHVVSYKVTIEVIPELSLSFDEHTFSEPRSTYDYVLKTGEPLGIKCMAVGSRPPASLTWVVNGEDVDPSNVHNVLYKPNKERINTTDSESTLHLLPTGTHVNISCQFRGIELVSQNLTINFVIFESSDDAEKKDLVWSLVAVICFLLILLAFTCGIFISRIKSRCSCTDVSTINNGIHPPGPSAQIFTADCFTEDITVSSDNHKYYDLEPSNNNDDIEINIENPNVVYYKAITS